MPFNNSQFWRGFLGSYLMGAKILDILRGQSDLNPSINRQSS
jgi:hypothetical protein